MARVMTDTNILISGNVGPGTQGMTYITGA